MRQGPCPGSWQQLASTQRLPACSCRPALALGTATRPVQLVGSRHDLERLGGTVRCRRCGATAATDASRARLASSTCVPTRLQEMMARARAHLPCSSSAAPLPSAREEAIRVALRAADRFLASAGDVTDVPSTAERPWGFQGLPSPRAVRAGAPPLWGTCGPTGRSPLGSGPRWPARVRRALLRLRDLDSRTCRALGPCGRGTPCGGHGVRQRGVPSGEQALVASSGSSRLLRASGAPEPPYELFRGHHLVTEGPYVYCLRCGGSASTRQSPTLLSDCLGQVTWAPSRIRMAALANLQGSRHPRTGVPIGGHGPPGPRR